MNLSKDPEQLSLIDEHTQADNGPVVCLGMTFENDQARLAHFRNELRKKLPELKQIQGFPMGEDEEIIALSDPPYYTACPNPWINDFIEECEREKGKKSSENVHKGYQREPFASDVKEGKNDPIYNAHSYHTKVPYKAIIRYMLHYTKPGDIIFDGFSGSGMTGVAGQLCADKSIIEEMGYYVDQSGDIFEKNDNGELNKVSELGSRKVILSELSPAASFMAYVYNCSTDTSKLEENITISMDKMKDEYSFLYYTLHNFKQEIVEGLSEKIQKVREISKIKNLYEGIESNIGHVNYIVWSDLYICAICSKEINFHESTVNPDTKEVSKEMVCPHCNAVLNRNHLDRVFETYYDEKLNKSISLQNKYQY